MNSHGLWRQSESNRLSISLFFVQGEQMEIHGRQKQNGGYSFATGANQEPKAVPRHWRPEDGAIECAKHSWCRIARGLLECLTCKVQKAG